MLLFMMLSSIPSFHGAPPIYDGPDLPYGAPLYGIYLARSLTFINGFFKLVPLVLVVCSPIPLVVFFAQLCPFVL
jgi:hypothetical protein